jgi:hypothetical protein
VFLCQIVIETWGITGQRVGDFTLYSGLLGTAFLLFKSYLVTRNTNDLTLCSQIIKSCDAASLFSRFCNSLPLQLVLFLSVMGLCKVSNFELLLGFLQRCYLYLWTCWCLCPWSCGCKTCWRWWVFEVLLDPIPKGMIFYFCFKLLSL